MKTLLLILFLTFFKAMVTDGQTLYGGVDLGISQVLKENGLYASGYVGYGLPLDRIDLLTEFTGFYYTTNRWQGALMVGSTVFTEHLVLLGGISTVEKRVTGKMEVKGSTYPSASLRYQCRWFGKKYMTGERLAIDYCFKIHYTYQTFTVGVGINSFKIR